MTGRLVFHVALADDWEMSLPSGFYEAATRGRSLDDEGFIHATTADGVQHVLDSVYADVNLPLLLIALDADAPDLPVEWGPAPRILGPIPCTDATAVADVTELTRSDGRWLAPIDPGGPR